LENFFSTQLLNQFAKLDALQVIQFVITLLVVGMMIINLRQLAAQSETNKGFTKTTGSLLQNMQTQSTQSNDRENKLATAIENQAKASEHQAQESGKIAQALLLINSKVVGVGDAIDDTQKLLNTQHTAAMTRIDNVATNLMQEIQGLKAGMLKMPEQQAEILRRLDRVTGYLELLQVKLRTAEVAAVRPTDLAIVRSSDSNGGKMESPEKPI
jgi:hypothetical protein